MINCIELIMLSAKMRVTVNYVSSMMFTLYDCYAFKVTH